MYGFFFSPQPKTCRETEHHNQFATCLQQSFLIEITASIFSKKDDLTDDGYVVDKILDKTGAYSTWYHAGTVHARSIDLLLYRAW